MRRRFNCVSGKAEEAKRPTGQSAEPERTEPEPQRPDPPHPEPSQPEHSQSRRPRTNWLRQKRSRRNNRHQAAWRVRESDYSDPP